MGTVPLLMKKRGGTRAISIVGKFHGENIL